MAASTEGTAAAVKAIGWQASVAKVGALVGIGGTMLGAGAVAVQSPASEPATVVEAASVPRPSVPTASPTAPVPAGASVATLSIRPNGISPRPLHANVSSTSPVATGADRPRAQGTRAAASRRAPPSVAAPAPDAPRQPTPSSIREEIDLLDRARTQLSRGNSGAAGEIIAQYLARYPNGELRAEAELVRREARMAGD